MDVKSFLKKLKSQDPRLTKAIASIATAVDKRGAPARALLVGGFVRDVLLGLHPKDADVEVFGVAPEDLEALATKLFGEHIDAVGKSFGVLKVFLGDGFEMDITLPRRESKAGRGHKGFLIDSDPFLSVEEAARRRDFTVNAISADPLTGEILDPFHGLKDLEKRVLRVVDPEHFVEDPLRVYRAVQFSARFGCSIEKKSFALMKKMVARGDLAELTKERVSEEIRKLLLKSPKPSVGFELMRSLGILKKYYPELNVLARTPQEPEWHPEGDVWIHTMMVLDEAAKIIRRDDAPPTDDEKLQLMVGALCHDLGKASTTGPGEKHGIPRIRSLGHEAAGEEPTRTLLSRWAFGEAIERAAILSATEHMHPSNLFRAREANTLTEAQYVNSVRKLLRRIQPLDWRVFLAVTEADHRGRGFAGLDTEPYEMGIKFADAVRKFQLEDEAKKTLIQGRDIITFSKKLGKKLKPGPRFGEIIAQIESLRDAGAIKTRKEALEKLKELLKA